MLSLVIPAFNEQESIAACLDCIADQTMLLPDEVLVVDNNSTDTTVAIVKSYADRLPIRILSEPRQGVTWARETGFNHAAGDLVGRIDADTRIEADWVETAVGYLSAHRDVDAIVGATYFYGVARGSGKAKAFERAGKAKTRAANDRENAGSFPTRMLSGNNCVVRKEAWNIAFPKLRYPSRGHEDIDLSFALAETGHTLRMLP